MAGIQSKIAAAKSARKPVDDGGEDVAVRVANLERELAEARAKLGETEKSEANWRTRAEQSDARYTSEKIRSALASAAAKAQAVDTDDIVDLVINRGARIDGDRVVFGHGADVKDADAFISAFVESKPHLKRSAPVAQGSGSPTTSATSAPVQPPEKHDLKTKEGATAAVGGALLKLANKNAKST